jgi:predicted phosphate transport protein (TIGR00153 family)
VKWFGKKDVDLFRLYKESSRMVVRGGDILADVVQDYSHLDTKMAELTEMEHEGDRIIQELVERLNTSFILPFDREDAFKLAHRLAATLNYITGIIDRMILYKAAQPNQTVNDMVQLLSEALPEQEKAFAMLENVEKHKMAILQCVERIKTLERKEDSMYRRAVAQLFEAERDAIQVIKYKEVYEHIETAMDYCEEVGDVIGNICMKYS